MTRGGHHTTAIQQIKAPVWMLSFAGRAVICRLRAPEHGKIRITFTFCQREIAMRRFSSLIGEQNRAFLAPRVHSVHRIVHFVTAQKHFVMPRKH